MEQDISQIFNRDTAEVKLLSLVIPVFNESRSLPRLIRVLGSVKWPVATEWLFVDDASLDNSVEVIEKFKSEFPSIRLIKREKNGGKGSALRVGIDAAQGQVIAIQDADLEYDPNDLVTLCGPLIAGKADVVYGSRFKRDVRQVHRTFHRYANALLTLLSNLCTGIFLSDMETCYKVFRADVLKSFAFDSDRFGFEPEVTAYMAKFRLRILEYPISYFPRSYVEGKKINWKDGIAAFWFIFKYNFLVSPEKCLKDTAKESLAGHVATARH